MDLFLVRWAKKMTHIKEKLNSMGITGELSTGTIVFIGLMIGFLLTDLFTRIREPKSHGLIAELFCHHQNGPDGAALSDADAFFAAQPLAHRQASEQQEEGFLLRQERALGLPSLPFRSGPPPRTAAGVCQYQLDQLPSKDFALLVRYEVLGPSSTILRKPGVSTGQSTWEKPPTTALFYSPPENQTSLAHQFGRQVKEFAFLQEVKTFAVEDLASWHLILHPADARLAVGRGWCRFHPMAGRFEAEPGFVMFYAPRDAAEVAVLARLLSAAFEYTQQMFKQPEHASTQQHEQATAQQPQIEAKAEAEEAKQEHVEEKEEATTTTTTEDSGHSSIKKKRRRRVVGGVRR